MRFGLHLPNSGVLAPAVDLVAIARRAEEAGFDAVWVFDHLFNPVRLDPRSHYGGPSGTYHNLPDMPYYEALTTLAVVAGATERIRLGTRVLPAATGTPPARRADRHARGTGWAKTAVARGGCGWEWEEFDALGPGLR